MKQTKEERFVRDMIRRTCINGNTKDALKAVTALVRAVNGDAANAIENYLHEGISEDEGCSCEYCFLVKKIAEAIREGARKG